MRQGDRRRQVAERLVSLEGSYSKGDGERHRVWTEGRPLTLKKIILAAV